MERFVSAAIRPVLLLQFGAFLFMVAGTHGAFAPQPNPPTTTDFASFYTAGILANRGTPALAYVPAAHQRAEGEVIAPGVEEKRFLNPPVFLFVCAPLARLPYLPAFLLFEGTSFVLWLTLATRIAGGGTLAAMALASVPSVWWALGWGQNSFLSAAFMASGTLLLGRRPFWAGLAFGALCFKPHFGVLLPVALLAGRQWRALLGAAVCASLLAALSTVVFGLQTWRSFVSMAAHVRTVFETGIQLAGHVDLGGAARLAGVSAPVSWAMQLAGSLVAATCVGWVWSRVRRAPSPENWAAAYAALIAGTLVAMPFVLFYDLVMAATAAAWLVRAARGQGWRSGELGTLTALGIVNLLAFPAATLLHLAVGAWVSPALLWLAICRTPVAVNIETLVPGLAASRQNSSRVPDEVDASLAKCTTHDCDGVQNQLSKRRKYVL